MSLSGIRFGTALVLFSAALSFGCSKQTEGERCSLDNLDSDCDGDLVCTEAATLRANDEVDRCCPPLEDDPTDSRCERSTVGDTTTGDGDGSAGGQGGMSSEDEPASLGSACSYNSECTPLVCGPQGQCQFECQESVDCDDGEICNAEQTCVPE